jgi:hypothetical protein
MGHATVSITADIYGHLTLDTKPEAVSVLGRVLSLASS